MRTIKIRSMPSTTFEAGFRVWTLRSDASGEPLDPFIVCDLFEMAVPYFPPHPHAGFSAVTYMLPDSRGGFINRDSLGDRSRIGPGDVHWTEAASGMLHEEVPEQRGVAARGLQIFVDLPASEKRADPRVYHCAAPDVPRREFGDALGRVVAGGGIFGASAIEPRTTCMLIDLEIPPEGNARVSVPKEWRVFGVRYTGALAQESASEVSEPALAIDTYAGSELILLTAGVHGARVVLLGGPPLRQPLAFGGTFIMSTEAELTNARLRFARGEMGSLTPSFRPS